MLVYASATESLIATAFDFNAAFDDDLRAVLDAYAASEGGEHRVAAERELLAWLDSIHPETAALAYRMEMFKRAHASLHSAARAAHPSPTPSSEVPPLPGAPAA